MPLPLPVLADTIGDSYRAFFGRSGTKGVPKYEGEFGSDKFLKDIRAGNQSALDLLKRRGYGTSWDLGFRKSVAREVRRDAKRGFFGKMTPRGMATGYFHSGLGSGVAALKNINPIAHPFAMGVLPVALGLFDVANAPRGEAGHRAGRWPGQENNEMR